MKIMLADDEESIQKLVEKIVVGKGYDFCAATDGEEAIDVFYRENPDLLILDVMMPEIDGFQVCRMLRESGAVAPIVFLSARSDIIDKSIGFNAGGDDYLVKPFSPQELALRIEAHLRRQKRISPEMENNFSIGDFAFDIKRKRVMKQGKAVELTPKEFMILVLLARHPGEIFTREQLTEEIWGKEFVGETSSVAVFIRRIREKIEKNPSRPQYIQTVWRAGYRFGD
ncbi:MAG: response regulator transcription factor [Coriobacteriales bacterium]|nr:response regulator transcription factor [Coriobacteriales bacterium]